MAMLRSSHGVQLASNNSIGFCDRFKMTIVIQREFSKMETFAEIYVPYKKSRGFLLLPKSIL
jgi:hypothetical protein